MAWLSRANWAPSDVLSYTALNNLANDIRTWGGNVNAGGYKLFNFEIDAPVSMTSTTTNAAAIYNVDGVAGPGLMQVNTFNNDPNAGSGALFTGARGSKAAPTDVLLGDRIGAVVNSGYAGGAYRYGSSMESYVDTVGAVSASSLPADLRFYTTPNGSINRVERMRITSGGNVGIGMTPNAAYKLDVTGDVRVTGNFTATNILGLTKASVGLGNVDNTSDLNKPVSTATQTALNGKQNTITGAPGAWPATFPPSAHTHAESDIPTLAATLALKANLAAPAFTGGITVTGAIAASGAITSAGQTLIPSPDTTNAALLYLRRNAANNAWELAAGGAGGGGGDVYGGGNLSNVGRITKVTAGGAIGESVILESSGNVGVSTPVVNTIFQVRSTPTDQGNYTYRGAVTFKSATFNGGAALAAAEPALILCREGKSGEAYGCFADFNLKRYENAGVNSRTQLDIGLAHDIPQATGGTVIMSLLSSGNVGIGTTVSSMSGNSVAGRVYVTVKGASDAGVFEAATGGADTDGAPVGQYTFVDPQVSPTDKRVGMIFCLRSGSTAGNRGSALGFNTKADGGVITERMRIDNAGRVGIGMTPVSYLLDVNGTGRFRTNLDVWSTDAADALRIFNTAGNSYMIFRPENSAGRGFIGYWANGAWGGMDLKGNADTATTATNQSGGTVSGTTGTFSGLVNCTGNNSGGSIAANAGGGGQVQAFTTGANASIMSFHRGGSYAVYLGLDTDNVMKIGGWSMGAVAYPILTSGNYASYISALNTTTVSGRLYVNSATEAYGLQVNYNSSTKGLYIGGGSDGSLVMSADSGAQRNWFFQNGNIGIGTNLQPYTVTIDTSPYGTAGIGVYRCTNNNEIASIQITKSRGTSLGAPATVQVNDYLGGFLFNGFTNAWKAAGGMQAYASYVSGANMGADTVIYSCNTSSVLSEAIHITNAQYNLMGYSVSQGSYRLQVNSQIFASNATIATSDGRYKENVVQINGDGALAVINALRPVTFNWKKHPVHNFIEGRDIGFIAQDVQTALANADYTDAIIVKNQCNYHDEDHNVVEGEEFLGMATANLIPILTAAIQELSARLAKLESASRN